ncbi:MAG TPA: RHS repeat-associated core domain-containing protein, partial [Terracidiphilus sp.]|nr:RHS repeat-associated core domain-containing protein [Terracidiphilus sp.]
MANPYNAEGRLCAVENPSGHSYTGYLYNAEGIRVAAGSINSLSCPYNGSSFTLKKVYLLDQSGNQVTELDASGSSLTWAHSNPVNEYIYFDGMRIARRDSGGNVYYSFGNELRSPTITTATGSICYDADFYPFGGERAYTSTCAPNQKFAGMEQDSATGLYRTIFRQYAANNGRWLSPDPYNGSYDPTNPQSMNRY